MKTLKDYLTEAKDPSEYRFRTEGDFFDSPIYDKIWSAVKTVKAYGEKNKMPYKGVDRSIMPLLDSYHGIFYIARSQETGEGDGDELSVEIPFKEILSMSNADLKKRVDKFKSENS